MTTKVFSDSGGRQWSLSIHTGAIKRVRDEVGFDLLGAFGDEEEFQSFMRITTDPVLLVDVLYCLCKDQCEKSGMSADDFASAICGGEGEGIERATIAVVEMMPSFGRSPSQKEAIRRLTGAFVEAQEMASKTVLARIEKELPSLLSQQRIDEIVNAAGLGESSTGSPESSA